MEISRRTFGKLALATGAASTLPTSTWASNRIETGAKSIDVLSDGYMQFPPQFIFGDIPKADYEPILAANGMSSDVIKPDCNLTLYRDGERTVLFDVGAGPYFLETTGQVLDALDELEVDPSEVTHVVFTHAHPDHLWGLIDDFDELVFPEAEYLMSRLERDFWISDKAMDVMPEARKSFAAGAKRMLGAIEDQITAFDFGQEVLPGIYAQDSIGHTPGHTSFDIAMGTENVTILGDSIGNHHVAFMKPDWASGSDQDKDQGVKTRLALLDKMVTDQNTFVGFHLPYPGIGRVERKDSAYRFVPAE